MPFQCMECCDVIASWIFPIESRLEGGLDVTDSRRSLNVLRARQLITDANFATLVRTTKLYLV